MTARRPTLDACCVTCQRHLPERDFVCLATEECVDAFIDYLTRHSPGMAKAHSIDPDAFRDNILRNHQQKGSTAMASKAAPKKSTPRAKVEKAPAFCRHCGGQTGGGKFLPGHDAALHGILIRQAQAGDVEGLTELLCYDKWTVPEGVDPKVEQAARSNLRGLDTEAFALAAAETRNKQFSAGKTLEQVYGDSLKRQPKPRKPKAEKAPAKKVAAKKVTKKATAKTKAA
jgi:hypothetical protein